MEKINKVKMNFGKYFGFEAEGIPHQSLIWILVFLFLIVAISVLGASIGVKTFFLPIK